MRNCPHGFDIYLVKFTYSEKATNFCKISTIDLSYVVTVKSTLEISQNVVAFSECMNFIRKFTGFELGSRSRDWDQISKVHSSNFLCPSFYRMNLKSLLKVDGFLLAKIEL